MRTAIGSAPSRAVRDEIAARYAELATAVGDPRHRWQCAPARSARTVPTTFAGQQDTILWVRGVPDICDAVSAAGQPVQHRAVSYRRRFGGAAAPAMGVTSS